MAEKDRLDRAITKFADAMAKARELKRLRDEQRKERERKEGG